MAIVYLKLYDITFLKLFKNFQLTIINGLMYKILECQFKKVHATSVINLS